MKKMVLAAFLTLVLAGCVTLSGTARWDSDRPEQCRVNAAFEWNYDLLNR